MRYVYVVEWCGHAVKDGVCQTRADAEALLEHMIERAKGHLTYGSYGISRKAADAARRNE